MNPNVSVEELVFMLLGISFSESNDPNVLDACIDKAYRDLCRTINYKFSLSKLYSKSQEKRQAFLEKKNIFYQNIKNILHNDIAYILLNPRIDYDGWHKELCEKIGKVDATNLIDGDGHLSVGQAQKWINMTVKYMRIIGKWNNDINGVHIPIDTFIIDAASIDSSCEILEGFGVNGLGVKKSFEIQQWSKISDYNTYLEYQNELRKACIRQPLVQWESKAWMAEAVKHSQD